MRHDAYSMTSIDGVLTPEAEPATPATPDVDATTAPRRRRVWPRVLIGFVVGFLLCMALAAGALYAYDSSHEARVLGGVSVGGVDLSGLDHDQAVATLEAAYAGYGDGPRDRAHECGRRRDPVFGVLQAGRHRADGRRGPADWPRGDAGRARRRGGPPRGLRRLDRAAGHARSRHARRSPAGGRRQAGSPGGRQPAPDGPEGHHGDPRVPGPLGRRDGRRRGRRRGPAAAGCPGRGGGRGERRDDAADARRTGAACRSGRCPTDDEAGGRDARQEAVEDQGRDRALMDRFEVRPDGSSWPTVDEAAISKSLTKVAKAVKRAPISAGTSRPVADASSGSRRRRMVVDSTRPRPPRSSRPPSRSGPVARRRSRSRSRRPRSSRS